MGAEIVYDLPVFVFSGGTLTSNQTFLSSFGMAVFSVMCFHLIFLREPILIPVSIEILIAKYNICR